MPKVLTKVEKLDYQYPGLADQLRQWMSEGISSRRIAELVLERYQVCLSKFAIAYFRKARWVPERELLLEKKIEARAAQEVASERETKAALAWKNPGEAR